YWNGEDRHRRVDVRKSYLRKLLMNMQIIAGMYGLIIRIECEKRAIAAVTAQLMRSKKERIQDRE
ncbi:MAG: hypothetical protein AABZ61_06230, partial [Bacteroidota bacterium]